MIHDFNDKQICKFCNAERVKVWIKFFGWMGWEWKFIKGSRYKCKKNDNTNTN